VLGAEVATGFAVALLGCAVLAAVWGCRRIDVRAQAQSREAQARADALLRRLLTDAEYRQLAERGHLEVPSPSRPGRTYLVPRRPGQVRVYEHGVPLVSLCVGPVEPLPDADVVLLHRLMIQANEDEYLRQAHHFPLRWPTARELARRDRARLGPPR
jgi:hypothetical protein